MPRSWAGTNYFLQYCLCAQRRLRSARAPIHSKRKLYRPSKEGLDVWLPIECEVMTLISVCICAYWTESLLGEYVKKMCRDSYLAYGSKRKRSKQVTTSKIFRGLWRNVYTSNRSNSNMSRDNAFPTRLHVRPTKTDQPAHLRSLISCRRPLIE